MSSYEVKIIATYQIRGVHDSSRAESVAMALLRNDMRIGWDNRAGDFRVKVEDLGAEYSVNGEPF